MKKILSVIISGMLCFSSAAVFSSCSVSDITASFTSSKYDKNDTNTKNRYFLVNEDDEYLEFNIIGVTTINGYYASDTQELYYDKSEGYTIEMFEDVTFEDLFDTIDWDLIPDKSLNVTEDDDFIIITLTINNILNTAKEVCDSGWINPEEKISKGDRLDGNSICDSLGSKELSLAEYTSKKGLFKTKKSFSEKKIY